MSHSYVSKKKKAADLKSTAYTFTVVGAGGLVFDLFGVIRDLSTKGTLGGNVMTPIVMGVMFLIFLIIGIRSFTDAKQTAAASVQEEQFFEKLTEDFRKNHSAKEIDSMCDTADKDQIYFARYDVMQHILLEQAPDLEESFSDHIIETLYAEFFTE